MLDQQHLLTVDKKEATHVFVSTREWGSVYLREAPDDVTVGDKVSAFVYQNATGDICATAATPKVTLGQCAYLRVVAINDVGAFLDWGLPKDLLLPYAEQAYPVREGASYVVYAYRDNSGRTVASTQLHHHLDETHEGFSIGDQVDLLIAGKSDLGFKAVINGKALGLLYHSDLSQPLAFGHRTKGWVKQIRQDGKIDLTINALDQKTRDQLELRILKALQQAGGRIELSDKSTPEVIFSVFKVSKKNFKRALGSLYKQRLIAIHPSHVELTQ